MPVSNPRPDKETTSRRTEANNRRRAARQKAQSYPNPATQFNKDESTLEGDGYAMSFTKGLHHNGSATTLTNDNGIHT